MGVKEATVPKANFDADWKTKFEVGYGTVLGIYHAGAYKSNTRGGVKYDCKVAATLTTRRTMNVINLFATVQGASTGGTLTNNAINAAATLAAQIAGVAAGDIGTISGITVSAAGRTSFE